MNRIWLVTNAASGSYSADTLSALEAQLETLGCITVETSDFPESRLPDAKALAAADIDTLVLYAGDGSIAAAIKHSAGWKGDVLVLPGGTMNLLAKRLHGERGIADIVKSVKQGEARAKPLSGAAIGDHVALVGIIAGPVTAWAQAREDVREGALTQLPGSVVAAVRETVAGDGVRVAGIDGAHRAVFVFPEGALLEAIVPAPGGFGDGVRLGWDMLTGDWRTSPGVGRIERDRIALEAPAELDLLVDGEPINAAAPVTIERTITSQLFYATEAAL